MNEAVNRWVCDFCGKVVESPQSKGQQEDVKAGFPATEPDLPEGWLAVEVWTAGATKAGEFHSKQCAAKWLLKRERRRRVIDLPERSTA